MLQLREEFKISKSRVTVRSKVVSRGQPRRADIELCYKPSILISAIEAKSNKRSRRRHAKSTRLCGNPVNAQSGST